MDPVLKNFKLIAQGGQADIFEVNEQKILRVLRNPSDEALLKREMKTMQNLKEQGFPVPEVFEYLTIEGRPALVVERIKGGSMLSQLQGNPLRLLTVARQLAKLHLELGEHKAENDLINAKARARSLTEKSELLSRELKEFVYSLLDELPEGNSLCHGDFHPGNILVSEGDRYLIDWAAAFSGPILSDIAHSYILIKKVPRVPGVGNFQYQAMKVIGKVFANKYLHYVRKQMMFDWDEFSKWTVVKAAERTVRGLPFEMPERAAYVNMCFQMSNNNVPCGSWYLKV